MVWLYKKEIICSIGKVIINLILHIYFSNVEERTNYIQSPV